MNYEELLIAKAGGKLNQSKMPIGEDAHWRVFPCKDRK